MSADTATDTEDLVIAIEELSDILKARKPAEVKVEPQITVEAQKHSFTVRVTARDKDGFISDLEITPKR